MSRDEAYELREFAIVAPVTTRVRRIPTEVPLGTAEGLPRPSVVNADVLTTIAKNSLAERAGALSASKLRALEGAVHFALGLECDLGT